MSNKAKCTATLGTIRCHLPNGHEFDHESEGQDWSDILPEDLTEDEHMECMAFMEEEKFCCFPLGHYGVHASHPVLYVDGWESVVYNEDMLILGTVINGKFYKRTN